MSQYQRMISYLYRYEGDVKKDNTGYARIELRGDSCRITVQMRDSLSELPEVAFFRQQPQGMQRLAAGRLKRNGSSFGCRIETRVDNILNSGYAFSDLDGLVIQVNQFLYFATTWKDITVHLGEEGMEEDPVEAAETEQGQADQPGTAQPEPEERTERAEKETDGEEQTGRQDEGAEGQELSRAQVSQEEDAFREEEVSKEEPISGNSQSVQEKQPESPDIQSQSMSEAGQASSGTKEASDTIAACQCEACCRCPQRKRVEDFGRHMLAMFPRMYPFEIDSIEECVRLELKDIGCLPVRYWSLSGNPFLLHGYYCYRHILFTKTTDGGYYIGTPGIYNHENEKKARSCGFGEFKPLSDVSDRRGAFGYWLFAVDE